MALESVSDQPERLAAASKGGLVETERLANQPAMPPSDQCHRQVQRILQSVTFRNTATLQQLLQFIAEHALADPKREPLKEYVIGVGAFGRPQDFDPKTDTIVRVQVHRLKQKLREYYDSEGRRDPILVEIPKGQYVPVFETVEDAGAKVSLPAGSNLESDDPVELGIKSPKIGESSKIRLSAEPEGSRLRSSISARAVFACLAAAIVFAAGFLIGNKIHFSSANATGAQAGSANTAAGAFWANLLGNDSAPIIAHSDAVFLLDSHNDLFFFPFGANDYRGAPVDPHVAQQFAANPKLVADAGKLYYENGYTGSGDLDAVGIVSNLLGQMGIKPVIEPGRDLTPGDLKLHNAILIGSSFQSYAVGQFNSVGDFTFVNPNPRLGGWLGTIANSHPRPGEQAVYRTARDPATGVLTTDYALITIQPGVVPGRYVVDLGGIDTTGCAGAAMFATSRAGVEELTKALAAQGIHGENGAPPLFQALLSVRLQKGNEVLSVALLAVHPLSRVQKTSSSPN